MKPEWHRRGVKPIGLSVDPLVEYADWADDIAQTQEQAKERFPQGWQELRPYLRVVQLPD